MDRTFVIENPTDLSSNERAQVCAALLRARPDQFVSIRGVWDDVSDSVVLHSCDVIDAPSRGALWRYERVGAIIETWCEPLEKRYYGREATPHNGEAVIAFSGREVLVSALNTLTLEQYRNGAEFSQTSWPIVRQQVTGRIDYFQVGHIPSLAEIDEREKREWEQAQAMETTERERAKQMAFVDEFWKSLAENGGAL